LHREDWPNPRRACDNGWHDILGCGERPHHGQFGYRH
jgi:hypothetical protein